MTRPSLVVRACAALALSCALLGAARAGGGHYRIPYAFSGGNDGGDAATQLAFDGAGNAYGTTVIGGYYGCGTVFELSPSGKGWQETVLHAFTCGADGKNPYGGVILDRQGNLYGTTVAGGTQTCSGDGCGVAYELTPSGEIVLHDFGAGSSGQDGYGPGGALAFDTSGDLYGTTPDGGAYGFGTVFMLAPSSSGWQERVIHSFTGGADGGVGSLGPLFIDAARNLYGVTEIGGAHQQGTVFALAPHARGAWKLQTLYAFGGPPDAGSPYGGVVADASGNLFGTTYYGGASGQGSVFTVARSGKHWKERVLYSFGASGDGANPTSAIAFDAAGNLYGTTSAGGPGSCACGTVFELNAKAHRERLLHTFGGNGDGAFPYYGLTFGPGGVAFGATVGGGAAGQGVIFSLRP
jgi:uncharacterized repeat protein (TIGR03803 family)